MYRVQFLCPRQGPQWQDYTQSVLLVFFRPGIFDTYAEATRTADGLIWQYHAARVIDQFGRVVYQV